MKVLWLSSSSQLKPLEAAVFFRDFFYRLKTGKNGQKGDLECALFCGFLRGNPHFLFHFSMCRYVTYYDVKKKTFSVSPYSVEQP